MSVRPAHTITLHKPVLLFVEGADDKGVLEALTRWLHLESRIQILLMEGKNNLRGRLLATRNAEGFAQVRALGIVLDADEDAKRPFQSACDALRVVGWPVPQAAAQVVGQAGAVRTGILILPPQQVAGAIEDVFLHALNDSRLMRCVEDYAMCAAQTLGKPLEKPGKMRLQTYLAATAVGKRLGESAGVRDLWDWNHPAFAPLISFLRELTSVDE